MTLQDVVVGVAVIAVLFYLYSWFVNRPVLLFTPTELTIAVQTGESRVVTRKQLVMTNGGYGLKVGDNEFYLLIKDGQCTWYPLSAKAATDPILRGSEKVVLLRLALRVERLRVTKYRCANLSDLEVQLTWGTEMADAPVGQTK